MSDRVEGGEIVDIFFSNDIAVIPVRQGLERSR